MNAPEQVVSQSDIEQQMQATLAMQREDYLREGVVTAETRIDRLQRGIDVLISPASSMNRAQVPCSAAFQER